MTDTPVPLTVPGATDDVDVLLLRLSRMNLAATVRAGADVTPPLSPTQIRALTVLSADPRGMSLTALAHQIAATLPSASRIVQRLVRDGLVVRSAGPGNELRLTLSPAGSVLLAHVNRARVAPLRALVDGLPTGVRHDLLTGLHQLSSAAEKVEELW